MQADNDNGQGYLPVDQDDIPVEAYLAVSTAQQWLTLVYILFNVDTLPKKT